MKKKVIFISTLAIGIVLNFSSCKKNSDAIEPDKEGITIADEFAATSQSKDNTDVEGNISDALSDINQKVAASNSLRTEEFSCSGINFSETTITGTRKKFNITYNSDTNRDCKGIFREGNASVELVEGTSFAGMNAKWIITVSNYKVRREFTQTLMNGVWTVTNLTGGIAGNGTQVEYAINGNVNVDFLNDLGVGVGTRSWTLSEKKAYSSTKLPSNLPNSLTITGTGGTNGNVIRAGINRNGNNFTSVITSPIVFSYCDAAVGYKYQSGTRVHTLEREKGNVVRTETISRDANCINTYSLTLEKNGKTKSYTVNF